MFRFKFSPTVLLVLVLAARISAQDGSDGAGLPAADIEKLVAPIALYPDVLISQILPAATFPTDIVMASRWCQEHADLKGLDDQQWDLSVISVCKYPQVLSKMNTDLDWTNALGAAYLEQPDDVMTAIQVLRARTRDAGVLVSNPQQTVVTEAEVIRIVPTEKETIYVPQYDPQVIYVHDDDDDDDDDGGGVSVAGAITASALSFGAGMAMGAWLDNDCDWIHGGVVACRPGYWGGWGHRGAVVAWDNNWVAARGPRRGVIAGENGGIYRGPNGAAIWGDNGHGAAWTRGNRLGAPGYSGRYSNYNHMSNNRRNVVAGNTVNINAGRNTKIDRGDRNVNRGGNNINSGNRNNIGGGNSNNIGGGNHNNIGGGNRNDIGGGNRNNIGSGDRNNIGGGNRPGGNNPGLGNGGNANRPAQQPRSNPVQQNRKPSSLNDNHSSFNTQQHSNRGASSRGGGGNRGGGGGGGRRGR